MPSKPPVVFKPAGTDPTLNEYPIRGVDIRPFVTCGVFGFMALMAACGFLAFNAARATANQSPTVEVPTVAVLPSETLTETPGPTPTETETATSTPDEWQQTG